MQFAHERHGGELAREPGRRGRQVDHQRAGARRLHESPLVEVRVLQRLLVGAVSHDDVGIGERVDALPARVGGEALDGAPHRGAAVEQIRVVHPLNSFIPA